MDALEKRNKNCPKTKTRKEKSGSEASHEAPHHAAGSRTQQLIAECSSRLDFNQGQAVAWRQDPLISMIFLKSVINYYL
jgi:hypothetical protein